MAVMSVGSAVHAHEWHLLGVSYEDSGPIEELQCSGCGDITFR
jgi:hypothetical protein